MARYFFHLFDGKNKFPDVDGALCFSREEAAARALKDARAILAEELIRGQLRLDQRIEVTDLDGKLVHSLDFDSAFSITRERTRSKPMPPDQRRRTRVPLVR